MNGEYANKGYLEIKEQLDRTAVLDSKFKAFLLAWVIEACREAYENGRNDERHELNV